MKQFSFSPIPAPRWKIEHGGSLALNRRRSRRPLNIRKPVHLVLRSDLARGSRSLLKNKKTVLRVLEKFRRHFRVHIHEIAVCGNHLHLLVKAETRVNLQNFLRVFAGQVAQEILKNYPLQKHERGGTPSKGGGGRKGCPKNQRTFWSLLAYSRIVSWGQDFRGVKAYVIRNTLEALGLIAYTPRKTRFQSRINSSG